MKFLVDLIITTAIFIVIAVVIILIPVIITIATASILFGICYIFAVSITTKDYST